MKKSLFTTVAAISAFGMFNTVTLAQKTPVAMSTSISDGILETPSDSSSFQWSNPTTQKIRKFLSYYDYGQPDPLSLDQITPKPDKYFFEDGDFKREKYNWSDFNGEYDPASRTEVTLDSEERAVEVKYLVYGGNDQWFPWYKHGYQYNSLGQLESFTYYNGNDPAYKNLYQYDGLGNLTQEIRQNWDEQNSSYVNAEKYVYEFIQGNYTNRYEYDWDGSSWGSSGFMKLYYDGDSKLIGASEGYNYGDINQQEWEYDSVKIVTNSQNLITEYRVFYLEGSQWVPDAKVNYTYNSNGKLTQYLYSAFENLEWIYNYRIVYEYDGNNLTSSSSEEYDGNDFIMYHNYSYAYNNTDQPTKITHIYGPAYTGSESNTTTYYNFYYDDLPLDLTNLVIENVKVYPNPASEMISIELNDKNINSIEFMDMNGKVVFSTTDGLNASKVTLPVSNIPSGVYLVNVRSGSTVGTTRVAINH